MKIVSFILFVTLLRVPDFSINSFDELFYLPANKGIHSTIRSYNIASDTITTGIRKYGLFVVKYGITKSGYKLDCTLMIGGELVGMSTLTVAAPNYQFNIILNTNKAWGTFTVLYYPPNQVSTLEGDFYVVSSRSDTIRFKGTVAGWYTTQTIAPQQ